MSHQHVFRWRNDRPPSLEQFQLMFPDDWSCAAYLAKKRWPDGFVCPHCGCRKGWKLRSKPWVWQCSGEGLNRDGLRIPCGKQVSVTAGTVMHKTHLPLRTWFMAIHLVTTHSNGISALQLQGKLGIGSYKTAWLLLHKLRRAMVDPDRHPLGGADERVEVDESEIPFRTKNDDVLKARFEPYVGKLMIACAVEHIDYNRMGRIRLEPISGRGRADLHPFVIRNTLPGTIVMTDGNTAYRRLPGRVHDENVLKSYGEAHHVLPHVHRVFSLMKRWAMGVYHGLRAKHLEIYLQEFVFRFNRRRHYRSAFDTLLGIGMRIGARSYWDITGKWPYFRDLKEFVRAYPEHREDAYREAIMAGVEKRYALRLLEPDYPPDPPTYIRNKPPRPLHARRRTAFVFATH